MTCCRMDDGARLSGASLVPVVRLGFSSLLSEAAEELVGITEDMSVSKHWSWGALGRSAGVGSGCERVAAISWKSVWFCWLGGKRERERGHCEVNWLCGKKVKLRSRDRIESRAFWETSAFEGTSSPARAFKNYIRSAHFDRSVVTTAKTLEHRIRCMHNWHITGVETKLVMKQMF